MKIRVHSWFFLLFDFRHDGIDVRPQAVNLGDGCFEFRIQLGDVHDFTIILHLYVGADGEVVVFLVDRDLIGGGGEVFADEAVEKSAEDILLEIPAIDRAAHVVGDFPDLLLEGGALLDTCHC